MSTDKTVAKNLINTLEDGTKGFADAADKLSDLGRPDLAAQFRRFAEQRAGFSIDLENLAAIYGDDIDEDGTLLGTAHRGWMTLKDALAGSDPDGVLSAAEQGESYAIAQYEQALQEEISDGLRRMLESQFAHVRAAHSAVHALKAMV